MRIQLHSLPSIIIEEKVSSVDHTFWRLMSDLLRKFTLLLRFFVEFNSSLYLQVIKVLIQVSRRNSWAEIVHCKLICMLTNMFYQDPDGTISSSATPRILVEQVDLIGGIEFIFREVLLYLFVKLNSNYVKPSEYTRRIN